MGNELFEEVIRLSGLPRKIIQKELTTILKKSGTPPQKVTEPQLRKALARYLKEVINDSLKKS